MASSIYDFASLKAQLASDRAAVKGTPASGKLGPHSGSAPRVGVIFNPRSHRNRTNASAEAEWKRDLGADIHIADPGDRSLLPKALAEFAARGIDLLVINGGDGTVRDVLTCGYGVFGDNWPVLAVLPKGKTNALTHDLGIPREWDLKEALAAFESGSLRALRPLAVTQESVAKGDASPSTVLGFILGAGAFTKATQAGQSAHRLGAFNGLAVAATAAWTLLQSALATRANSWRKGAAMQIAIGPQKAPLGHSGQGDPAFRQMLFISSLDEMPGGIQPFGKVQAAGPTQFKLVAIDQIKRRTTMMLPAMMKGFFLNRLRERGIHQLAASRLSLKLDDQFILDGEAFPAGEYTIEAGPDLRFVTP